MTLADRGVTILLFTRGMASASYSLILRQLHAVIIDLARKGKNLLKQLVTKVTQHGAADALRLRFTESLVAGISSRIGYRTMLPVAFFSQRYLVFVLDQVDNTSAPLLLHYCPGRYIAYTQIV
jgi:hypothetical protein